jgi:hypothetical protein
MTIKESFQKQSEWILLLGSVSNYFKRDKHMLQIIHSLLLIGSNCKTGCDLAS